MPIDPPAVHPGTNAPEPPRTAPQPVHDHPIHDHPADDHPADDHPANHAGFLYGAVVAAATFAVLDEPEPDRPALEVLDDVLAVALTLLVYYVVHVYTWVLGERAVPDSGPTRQRVWAAMTHEAPVLLGGAPATVVYLLSCVFSTPAHALTAALQATTLVLGAVTWVLARRAGVRGWLLVAETVAVALLGVVKILLKVALH